MNDRSQFISVLLLLTVYQSLSCHYLQVIMTIRLFRKQTSKHPSNALFPQEQNTRIAPTQIINETELDLTAGMVVTVNWDREKVEAEIRLVYGTFITKTTFTLLFSQYHLQSHYCLSFTCQLCSVTHCRNGCMRKCGCFFFKLQESRTDIMIYVSQWREEICFILETMNFNAVSDQKMIESFIFIKLQRRLFQNAD